MTPERLGVYLPVVSPTLLRSPQIDAADTRPVVRRRNTSTIQSEHSAPHIPPRILLSTHSSLENRGYGEKEGDAREFHPMLRAPLHPQELEIDPNNGMKVASFFSALFIARNKLVRMDIFS